MLYRVASEKMTSLHHHCANLFYFLWDHWSHPGYFENRIPLGAYAASQTTVLHMNTQSNRVSDFRNFVCSLFLNAIFFFLTLVNNYGYRISLPFTSRKMIPRQNKRYSVSMFVHYVRKLIQDITGVVFRISHNDTGFSKLHFLYHSPEKIIPTGNVCIHWETLMVICS